ncbi:hypothetical protein niasHT_009716 [Heterodera trifolii]|uniref:Secreted protein n=1 Tax=Heterodera trifolii TaxID=157864 RepID=A0ABD2MDP4_9BILA
MNNKLILSLVFFGSVPFGNCSTTTTTTDKFQDVKEAAKEAGKKPKCQDGTKEPTRATPPTSTDLMGRLVSAMAPKPMGTNKMGPSANLSPQRTREQQEQQLKREEEKEENGGRK